MRYVKLIGLLAVAAAVLMAVAVSASATTLTSPAGTTYGVGSKIKAAAESGITLDGTIKLKCNQSTIEGEVGNAGGATSTVSGNVTSLTFTECGAATITVIKNGTFEIHTDSETADGNGVITRSNNEITVLTHNILGTVHCIYGGGTNTLGTLKGSNNTGGNATVGGNGGRPINQIETDFGCGETAEATGAYVISTPTYLDVD